MSKRAVAEPVNALSKLATTATRLSVGKGKEDRAVIVLTDPDRIALVGDMVRLGTLQADLKPQAEAHKKSATQLLFEDWVADFWATKQVPSNPTYVIKKPNTDFTDMEFVFQVRARTDGVDIRALDKMPAGTTVEDVVMRALLDEVGLSSENATRFVRETGELVVSEKVDFVSSLDDMSRSDDALIRSGAVKLLNILQSKGRGGRATIDAFNDDERAAMLTVQKVATLKDDFLKRLPDYCETQDQLLALLVYLKTTLMVTHIKFGQADTTAERVGRLQEAVEKFIALKN